MTNTGKLAHSLLLNSQVFIFGEKEIRLQEEDFSFPGYQNVILFPGAASDSLSCFESNSLPYNVIVPDGHWGQARSIANKIKRKDPSLKFVSLPKELPSEYGLRSHPDASKICTIEAIYRVLQVLEPSVDHDKLLDVFRVMRNRLLKKRGRLL